MKHLLIKILSLLLLSTLMNCVEEEVTSREYPRLRTLAVTDITSEGATFNAEFIFRGNFEILNYGFVWDTSPNPRVESSERVVIEGDIRSNEFTREIKSALAEDQKYYIRAFVKTEDFIVYGDNIEFLSLGAKAPVISKVRPVSGTLGDTITLSGQNFSYVENKVLFQDYEGKIVSATDTTLKVVVPDQIDTTANTITVTVKNNLTVAKDKFIVLPPDLLELSPNAAKTYDTVKIKGQFIGHKPEHIKVYFDKENDKNPFKSKVTGNSKNEISVIVPEGLKENSNIRVKIAGMTDSIEFNYRKPEIISIDRENISWGDTLVVKTQNFYSDKTKFNVLFNSSSIPVLDATDTSFSFIVPKTLKQKENKLFAEIAGFDLELDQSLFLKPLKILTVSADSVAIRDQVSIELENLHPENNEVFLNNIRVESSLNSALNNIKFKMPLEAKYYKETMKDEKVKVSIKANDILVADTIIPFKTPKILSVTQEAVAMGEEVIVKGLNFDPDIHVLKLMGEQAEIKSSTNSEIRFIVPEKPALFQKRDTLNRIPLEISFNESLKVGSVLTLKAPIITDISPSELTNLNEVVTVMGQNFGNSPVVEFGTDGGMFYNPQTKLEIDNPLIELISYSDNEIKFRITNLNLKNDKITQYFSSKIKIKSFGLKKVSAESINYKHLTNWKYLRVNPAHAISKSRRNFTQHGDFGFILGGYQLDGNRLYGEKRVFQLDPALDKFIQLKTWNNFNTEYNTWIANSFGFQNHLYAQVSNGKFRRYEVNDQISSETEWTDYPLTGDLSGFSIRSQFEHNNDLYFFTFQGIIKVSNGNVDHLSTFHLESFQLYFSKKVNGEFFIAVKNQLPIPYKLELHKYNISSNSWYLITDDYVLPSERRSSNRSLGDYLFDERYVYDYDFITGNKSIRFEFPENFTSPYDVDLLFKLGNKWYFNIKNEQYLIYNEN